jgi:hypothetical protein
MSDISISFPPWIATWFLLGEAAPFLTLVIIALVAAFLVSRGRLRRGLKWTLAIVGGLWLGGISFWAAGLVDQMQTAVYVARHHYRLDKATVLAGIEVPRGSWVSVDEKGVLYEIDTEGDAVVSIDGASWQGEIRLIYGRTRTAADRGIIKSATLVADAAIQGMPCRAGALVEFSEFGSGLEHCSLAQHARVTAEIEDEKGKKSTADLVCAAGQDVFLQASDGGLLERCVLAEAATVGTIACAGGKEILFAGAGLDSCTLAAAQRVGASDLSAGTLIRFTRGSLSEFEMPPSSASVAVSGIEVPPGTVVSLCERDIGWLEVPEDRYVTIAGIKLTGRLNFDCGKFQYGALFEDNVLGDRRLPRGAAISADDLLNPH